MNKPQKTWLRRLALLTILLLPTALAWSDAAFPNRAAEDKKMCYCGCDMKAGTPMCTRMCELPKYANRPWATTCQPKKATIPPPAAAPQSGSHSRRNNRVQSARL